jgi:F-type H+-transporting ATPase subunit epsilon
MHLKLQTPTEVIVNQSVRKIVAEGTHGSFCLLPRHVDYLAALVPGLLAFEGNAGSEQFVAVDRGILVKRADEVLVSVPRAVLGGELAQLRETVRREFATLDESEKAARSAIAKLEASFLREYVLMTEELG